MEEKEEEPETARTAELEEAGRWEEEGTKEEGEKACGEEAEAPEGLSDDGCCELRWW